MIQPHHRHRSQSSQSSLRSWFAGSIGISRANVSVENVSARDPQSGNPVDTNGAQRSVARREQQRL